MKMLYLTTGHFLQYFSLNTHWSSQKKAMSSKAMVNTKVTVATITMTGKMHTGCHAITAKEINNWLLILNPVVGRLDRRAGNGCQFIHASSL